MRTPTADQDNFASRHLNRMLKAFQQKGLFLFSSREAILFIDAVSQEYTLGPSGDHCSEVTYETAIRVAGSASDTSILVDTNANMVAGDNVGIELDDRTMQWATILSTLGNNRFTISALKSAAAIGNVVYWYTDKVQKPLKLNHAVFTSHDVSDPTDTSMYELSRSDYQDLSTKTTQSVPTQYWFEPLQSISLLHLYGTGTRVIDTLKLTLQHPFDDMDEATNTLSFPIEWLESIHLGLSYRCCRSYRPKDDKTSILKYDSMEALQEALDFATETANIELTLEEQWLQE